MNTGTMDRPNGVISRPPIVSAPRGSIQPHWLLLRTPYTARPSPSDESATPTPSSRGGCSSRGERGSRRRSSRMPATITVSPAKT